LLPAISREETEHRTPIQVFRLGVLADHVAELVEHFQRLRSEIQRLVGSAA